MQKTKNELMIVEKIEKRLQEPRSPTVFPLYAMHRKELRALKQKNLGNLRDQLSNIKTLKREEYTKKYSEEIKKELTSNKSVCEKLNKDWDTRIKKVRELLEEREKIESKSDTSKLSLKKGYNDISKLHINKDDLYRTFLFKSDEASKKIAEEEFEKKFGKAFVAISKKIDDLETKYEESINFGDLEIVKQLYYMMKRSDKFFDKIKNLEI